jgi:hypothetical protein
MKSLIAALPVVLALAVAGCSGAAVAPPFPSPSPAPSSPGPSPAAPGGSGPGSVGPVGPSPDDGVIGGGGRDPAPGQPTLVLPKPGRLDVHDVAIEQLSAKVAGRHVVVNARWWSGVEPCNVLDSVAAKRDGQTVTVSVREGSSNRDAICIEIAMLKITAIDLGDLEPGEYTIAASQGPAAAITVTVS